MKRITKDPVITLTMVIVSFLFAELGILIFFANITRTEACVKETHVIEYRLPENASPMAREVVKNLFIEQ